MGSPQTSPAAEECENTLNIGPKQVNIVKIRHFRQFEYKKKYILCLYVGWGVLKILFQSPTLGQKVLIGGENKSDRYSFLTEPMSQMGIHRFSAILPKLPSLKSE